MYTLKSCTAVRCEVCWVCELPCLCLLACCLHLIFSGHEVKDPIWLWPIPLQAGVMDSKTGRGEERNKTLILVVLALNKIIFLHIFTRPCRDERVIGEPTQTQNYTFVSLRILYLNFSQIDNSIVLLHFTNAILIIFSVFKWFWERSYTFPALFSVLCLSVNTGIWDCQSNRWFEWTNHEWNQTNACGHVILMHWYHLHKLCNGFANGCSFCPAVVTFVL